MDTRSFKEGWLDNLYEFLGVDKAKYVDIPVKYFEEEYLATLKANADDPSVSKWSQTFKLRAGITTNLISETKKDKEDSTTTTTTQTASKSNNDKSSEKQPEFDGHIQLCDKAKEFLNYTDQYVSAPLRLLYLFKNYIVKNKIDASEKAPEYCSDPLRKLACYIQNYKQRVNANRREAITTGQYKNPLEGDNHILIFKEMMGKIISDERNKGINAIIAREDAKNNNKTSALFTSTCSLEEAAGLLLLDCCSVGRGAFHSIIIALQDPDLQIPYEKIKMVTSGEYLGVILIKNIRKDTKMTWVPSRQNLYRMWVKHKNVIPKEKWIELFPSFKDYLEERYEIEANGGHKVKKDKEETK
eukprot:TRINITY_DN8020_c0_g2_i1.p1 TRINITY_DN8020_c0_g2~~TRINITY_DN8020_c0_g2_i1.p1  ORF type:complete len:396 (-),score=63.42 TRINITY_DN8020_c0_g2_i1:12-1082(-)